MKKYRGVYFPNSYFSNDEAFNSAFLFFDEVNIVSPMDIQDEPNNYFKNFKTPYSLAYFGSNSDDPESSIDLIVKTIEFAIKNRQLIGDGLVYRDHLLSAKIKQMIEVLMSGKGLPAQEVLNFIYGEDDIAAAFEEVRKHLKDKSDEHFLKVRATAYQLSKSEETELISDSLDDIVPQFDRVDLRVRQLTAILSENCFTVLMPRVREIQDPNELLELKHHLADVLVPYRLALQRLAGTVKGALQAKVTYRDISREASFLIESQIEPIVYEMQRKIEQSSNRLFVKILGVVAGWIPLVASAFIAPTPDKLLAAMTKVYGDAGTLGDATYERSLARDPGLSYVISTNKWVEKKLKKRS